MEKEIVKVEKKKKTVKKRRKFSINWFVEKIALFGIRLVYPLKIHNKQNLIKGNAVVVCNHYKILDAAFVMSAFGREFMNFLIKKEAVEKKFPSWFLQRHGCIPVDRDSIEMSTIKAGLTVLKDGGKLGLFPEGTRNKEGEELQDLKGGTLLFAIKTQSPIVPLMIAHKEKPFRRVHLIVGEPIEFTDYYFKKCTAEDYDVIAKELKEKMVALREELLEKLDKKKVKK